MSILRRVMNGLRGRDGDQGGFIPMIICLILVIAGVVYFSYQHVARLQQ